MPWDFFQRRYPGADTTSSFSEAFIFPRMVFARYSTEEGGKTRKGPSLGDKLLIQVLVQVLDIL